MTAPASTLPSSDHIDCSPAFEVVPDTDPVLALLRGELRRLAWHIARDLCDRVVAERFVEDHSLIAPDVAERLLDHLIAAETREACDPLRSDELAPIKDDCVALILSEVAR